MIERLLLCVDLTDADGPVIESGIGLARQTGASVEVLHVVAPEPDFVGYTAFMYPGRDEHADELRREKAQLKKVADQLAKAGVDVKGYMKEAPTVDGILDFARKHSVDVVMLGTHSKGIVSRFVLGSVARDIVAKSPIPVLVVPPSRES